MRIPFFDLGGSGGIRSRPLENKLAKRWVKTRLKKLFPELRNDPEALEKAYAGLGIEARHGVGKGGGIVYEISTPEREEVER